MSRPTNCQSYQERDGTHYCGLCGLRWDDDSIDPPDCSPVKVGRMGGRSQGKTKNLTHECQKVADRVLKPFRTQAEQDEINSSGMKRLRESMKDD